MEGPAIAELEVSAYTLPTDEPESDGTLEWHDTTMVLVEVFAGGHAGIGYTYASRAAGWVIADILRNVVLHRDAFDIGAVWHDMRAAVRNLGDSGIAAMAISAVDTALWDLKARLLGIPLCALLGSERDAVPVYGSGGFTSYGEARLAEQLARWSDQGMRWVKIKVGRDPQLDPERLRVARFAIGDHVELFVDANGACTPRQALAASQLFADWGVTWFEEPVPSSDPRGLHWVRQRAPATMQIAAGEYIWTTNDAVTLIEAQAVDVLQADCTRCGGITGWLAVAALAQAARLPMSAHCAPALHLHIGCATRDLLHLEYFHDHVRFEHRMFDGVVEPIGGALRPDRSAIGNGLAIRRADAAALRVA